MKAEGLNVLQPNFAPNANAEQSSELQSTLTPVSSKPSVITMTRDDVHRKITAEEFREQGKNQEWVSTVKLPLMYELEDLFFN